MLYRSRKDPSVQVGIGSGGGQNSSDTLVDSPERDLARARRRLNYQKNKEYYRASATYKYRRIITGNDSCDLCGYNKYQDALVVHHLDTDRSNNNEDNLVILCSNCHVHLHSTIRQRQKTEDIDEKTVFLEEKTKQ
jgi:5-methylcytosine-specific restriction endonuclease McrA